MTGYTAILDLHPAVDWLRSLAGQPLCSYALRALQGSQRCQRVLVLSNQTPLRRAVVELALAKVDLAERPELADQQLDWEAVRHRIPAEPDASILHLNGLAVLLQSADMDSAFSAFLKNESSALVATAHPPYRPDVRQRPGSYLPVGAAFQLGAKTALGRLPGSTDQWWPLPAVVALRPVDTEPTLAIEAILRARRQHRAMPGKAGAIRLFLTDVDGTLTDSGMYYSERGDELKKFNTRDGKGLQLLREAGIRVGIITGENRELVRRRSEKLGLDHLFLGIADKVPVVQRLMDELGIDWPAVAFIGDDVNDTGLLETVGYSAVPKDAIRRNRLLADYVCELRGGEGCVREFAERLLAERTARPI